MGLKVGAFSAMFVGFFCCVWFYLFILNSISNEIKAKSIFIILMEEEMLHMFRCFKILHSVYLYL